MNVEVKSSRSGPESFTISFAGKDPDKITKAVNILAEYFINESIKLMREEVYAASKFLQEELKSKSENLIKVENALKEYRTSFMGGLPEQLNSNLGMLLGLRNQMNTKQESLRDENVRKIQLESQMSDIRRELESYASGEAEVPEEIAKKEPDSVIRLRLLKDEYAKITGRYTEKHPDVIKVKKRIAEAEAEVEAEAKRAENEKSAEPQPETPKKKKKKGEADLIIAKFKETKEHQLKDMAIQYDEALRTIKGLEEDIAAISVQIKEYEKRIEDTPKREQELLTLSRDYENIKDSYNKLLTRKLDADIAVSMEMKSKGKKFRVLDSAQVPKKPVSPDIKKLLAMCLAGGLGLGGGLIFLLDFLDTSLRRPEDIETLLGVAVLATIPNVYYRRMDKLKQKIELVLTFIFLSIGFSLLGVFALMAVKNVEYVTEKATKVVTKLFL
jgi:polysaccharide chain length determinant protein (PEP-CTERM system associated)